MPRNATSMTTALRALAMLAVGLLTSGPPAAANPSNTATPNAESGGAERSWNFQVTLNDSPIGSHRFELVRQGDVSRLVGQANFDVKVLFVNAYRYRHQVNETWQGDCLKTLEASTDDNGKSSTVSARSEQDALQVVSPQGPARLPGCVMSFAYWNPALLKQNRLLNSQTGRYQNVTITALGDDELNVRGSTVRSRHYRLAGTENPIELWYSTDGNWLGLQTTVGGDKVLRYRLQ